MWSTDDCCQSPQPSSGLSQRPPSAGLPKPSATCGKACSCSGLEQGLGEGRSGGRSQAFAIPVDIDTNNNNG